MKCEQCSELIEDYFDGELDPSISGRVGAHIAECKACAALAGEIRQEHEIYASYHRDVDVTPALWANVQARIEQEKPVERRKGERFAGLWEWLRAGSVAPRLSPGLALALVVAAIGLTVGVMSYLHSRTQGEGQQIAAQDGQGGAGDSATGTGNSEPVRSDGTTKETVPPSVGPPTPPEERQRETINNTKRNRPPVSDPDQLVREAEQKYRVAIGILERGLKDQRSKLDPETRAQFDIALAKIDQTIEATRAAVRRNPADPIAVGYLVAAYSKKVDFLRETARDDRGAN